MKFNFEIVLLFLFLSGSLHACECIISKSFEEKAEEADVIFYGNVVGVEDQDDPVYEDYVKYNSFGKNYAKEGGFEPVFEIIENFKGSIKEHLEDGKFKYQTLWTNCDRFYDIGYNYIFFGYYDDKGKI